MPPFRTHAELSALNKINPDFAKHIAARPVRLADPSADMNTKREARANHLRSLHHLYPIPGPIPDIVEEKDIFIPAEDGYEIRVRIYAPAKPNSQACPVVVLYHEGGWSFGDLSDEEMNARMFVRELGAVCLNVEYRLAPENQFPIGIDDCYSVLKAVAAKPGMFHQLADPMLELVLGGSSAGGNISAVLAHRSREDRMSPPVTGQWLSVPFLVSTDLVPEKYKAEYVSAYENKDDPVIGVMSPERESNLAKSIGLSTFDDPRFIPFASALYPPTEKNQEGMAPLAKAYFAISGMDPIRDHGLIYERALREEWGVETRLDLYDGYGHMFHTNWPEMQESRKYWKNMVELMKWLLQ